MAQEDVLVWLIYAEFDIVIDLCIDEAEYRRKHGKQILAQI